MVSLCSVHQDASNDLHFDLKATLRSHDLRSTSDLELTRSSYTHSIAYREDINGAVIYALARLAQKLLT